MPLALLDRDGVLVLNRRKTLRVPSDLVFQEGAPEAVHRLLLSGHAVAVCTNQPEVARGVLSHRELYEFHRALQDRLSIPGGPEVHVLSCTCRHKSPRLKPAGGMLREAMAQHGALPCRTPFVGDQLDDLRAAFHAGCRRILVRTDLGRQTEHACLPSYLAPIEVHEDLPAFVDSFLRRNLVAGGSFT